MRAIINDIFYAMRILCYAMRGVNGWKPEWQNHIIGHGERGQRRHERWASATKSYSSQLRGWVKNRRRSPTRLSGPWPDEAGTARDRAAQARSCKS
jgi:hypothetical protein